MSLGIDIVNMVLLADGWHEVAGDSFDVDAYEYVHNVSIVLERGQVAGVPTMGATWREPDGAIVACPITAILAVKSNGAATPV